MKKEEYINAIRSVKNEIIPQDSHFAFLENSFTKIYDNMEAQLSETEDKLKEAYESIIGMVHNSCCRSYSKSLHHSEDCIVLEAQTWLEDKE